MKMTVREFIELLEKEDKEKELVFSGLDFYRLKDRDAFVQVEFSQTIIKKADGNISIENH